MRCVRTHAHKSDDGATSPRRRRPRRGARRSNAISVAAATAAAHIRGVHAHQLHNQVPRGRAQGRPCGLRPAERAREHAPPHVVGLVKGVLRTSERQVGSWRGRSARCVCVCVCVCARARALLSAELRPVDSGYEGSWCAPHGHDAIVFRLVEYDPAPDGEGSVTVSVVTGGHMFVARACELLALPAVDAHAAVWRGFVHLNSTTIWVTDARDR